MSSKETVSAVGSLGTVVEENVIIPRQEIGVRLASSVIRVLSFCSGFVSH